MGVKKINKKNKERGKSKWHTKWNLCIMFQMRRMEDLNLNNFMFLMNIQSLQNF